MGCLQSLKLLKELFLKKKKKERTISEAEWLDKLASALNNKLPLDFKDKGAGGTLSMELQREDRLIFQINYLLFLSNNLSFGFHKVLVIAFWKNSQSQQKKKKKEGKWLKGIFSQHY